MEVSSQYTGFEFVTGVKSRLGRVAAEMRSDHRQKFRPGGIYRPGLKLYADR